MTPIDERQLAAHLARRSSLGTPGQQEARSDRLADDIRSRVATERQPPARFWLSASPRLAIQPPGARIRTAMGAVVLVAAVGAIGLLAGVGGYTQSIVARTGWYLTTSELVAVVADAKSTGRNVGKTVVADVDTRFIGPSGSPLGGCSPCAVFIDPGGSSLAPIPVRNLVAPPLEPGRDTLALRINGDGSVDVAGRTSVSNGAAWPFEAFASVVRSLQPNEAATGVLYPVQGILTVPSGGPSCATTPFDPRFGCGWPAWLIAPGSGGDSVAGFGPPPNAIRVQNELRPAPPSGESGGQDAATYLLRPVVPMPTDCFECGDIGTVEIVARLDPIVIPTPSTSSPNTPSPSAIPTSPPVAASALQVLSEAQLEELVATSANVGRVVVADAQITWNGNPCAPVPCAPEYAILGEHHAIGVDAGQLDASAVRAPLAFRIVAPWAVQLIAQVGTPSSSGVALTVPEYRDEIQIQRLQPAPERSVPTAFVVDAWLETEVGTRFCPNISTIPPRLSDFTCGGWSWLTPSPFEWTDGLGEPPAGGLLVQNSAYADFAPDPVTQASPPLSIPRRGLYVIAPALTKGGSCSTDCEAPDAASILGRIDPVELLPSPAPTALSSHAEATLVDFKLTFDVPKTTWTSSEPITGTARLDYLGTGAMALAGSEGSAGGPFAFELADVEGRKNTGAVFADVCQHTTITDKDPLAAQLSKGGGFDANDPEASFYAAFFADPLYRLPPGDWNLTAVVDFYEKDCGGADYRIRATIRIHVTP